MGVKEMKKQKLLNLGLMSILIISVVFISGCVQEKNPAEAPVTQPSETSETTPQQITPETGLRSSNAEYIGNFITIADENKIEARFSLSDSSKEYISGDGVGEVRIINSKGETVYTGSTNVKKEDFGTYTLILTGEEFLAYVWEIPIDEIKKSTSSSGTIYLKFRTKNGEFEEIDDSVWGLPTYSEEELAQLNEEAFFKTSVAINKKLSKGNFEVTVTRVGFFTPLVTRGDEKEYFRIDMEVKNIGSEKEYFSPSGLAVLDNQENQYEKEYGGTLDTFSQMYPSVKKSGYILFERVPKTSQNIKLVFELGHDGNYDPYSFEYNIPLTEV